MALSMTSMTGYSNATVDTTTTISTIATAPTTVRYDYIFVRESCWIRWFFTVIYLSGNLISAICLALLIRLYFSKKYHKVHEKNLNSMCLSLLTINALKWTNFFWKNHHVNETLIQMNLITTFLLATTAIDLYLTLKSVIKDIFVEEAASRRRFAIYTMCGWLLPVAILRFVFDRDLLRSNFVFSLMQLHCFLNFATVALIHAGLQSYYRLTWCAASGNIEGYKYYSDEKYTSDIVRFLSTLRFIFHLLFLVSHKHVVLSILDFFRAYEGMYIYYCLAVERPNKWTCRCTQPICVCSHVPLQSCTTSV